MGHGLWAAGLPQATEKGFTIRVHPPQQGAELAGCSQGPALPQALGSSLGMETRCRPLGWGHIQAPWQEPGSDTDQDAREGLWGQAWAKTQLDINQSGDHDQAGQGDDMAGNGFLQPCWSRDWWHWGWLEVLNQQQCVESLGFGQDTRIYVCTQRPGSYMCAKYVK